jgi:hypothetical protein
MSGLASSRGRAGIQQGRVQSIEGMEVSSWTGKVCGSILLQMQSGVFLKWVECHSTWLFSHRLLEMFYLWCIQYLQTSLLVIIGRGSGTAHMGRWCVLTHLKGLLL